MVVVREGVSRSFGAAPCVALMRKYKAHMRRETAQMIKTVFLLNDGCIKTLKIKRVIDVRGPWVGQGFAKF